MGEDKVEGTQAELNLEVQASLIPQDKPKIRRNGKKTPSSPEVPPSAVDVLANKDKFIHVFKTFLDRDAKLSPRDSQDAKLKLAEENLLPFWGSVPEFDSRIVDKDINSRRNIIVRQPFAFSETEGFELRNAAVSGDDAFKHSKNAILDTVLLVSKRAFKGVDPRIPQKTRENSLVCINPSVSNAAIYGEDSFRYTENGRIEHSILGGKGTLANSRNIRLVDTWLVVPEGTYYFDDVEFEGRFRLEEKYRVV